MSSKSPSERNAPFFVPNETIVLSRNGVWLSDGQEITHDGTRRLFWNSLRRDADGYFLQVGHEVQRIEVEDTAWFVQRIEGTPDTEVEIWTTAGNMELLDPTTLRYRPGRLTCRLENGEEARFLHAAYFDLLKHMHEDHGTYYLVFGDGKRVDLALKTD